MAKKKVFSHDLCMHQDLSFSEFCIEVDAHHLRKTPLSTQRNWDARLAFKRGHLDRDTNWSSILWSAETKLVLFEHMDVAYVWRKKGEAFNPNNTIWYTIQYYWYR